MLTLMRHAAKLNRAQRVDTTSPIHTIWIGDALVTFVAVEGSAVYLAINAPQDVRVYRGELVQNHVDRLNAVRSGEVIPKIQLKPSTKRNGDMQREQHPTRSVATA